MSTSQQELVERIAKAAESRGLKVAAAESLTCGRLLSALGAGPNASTWLAGGVVAYDEEVKFKLLGVSRGPVITDRCARELATGVAAKLEADVAIGITGCGGPDDEEGQPPGTVFIAVAHDGEAQESHQRVDTDDPDTILDEVTTAALRLLADVIA